MVYEPQSRARLRVGFDARWYNDSGVGSYVHGLLGALAQADEIELLVYEHAENPVPLAADVQRITLKARKYSFSEQVELARRCRENRLDLFHSPFYVVPQLAQCPVVVTIHDLIPFRFQIYSSLKRAVVRSGYRLAARKATQIIADSNHTAEDIEQILGVARERVTVVPIAAQESYTAMPEAGEATRIEEKYGVRLPYVMVASARNWRTKNLETAFRVLEAARQSDADFQTVVFGSPEGFRAAGGEDRWRQLKLKCTGYIPANELAMLYRNAAVFLMPSLYEGFGLPVLEAMASGCAVACSNAGALAEVAGNGAQVFDPGDVPGMAAAVRRLLVDAVNLRSWREAALRRSREFSWQRAARETIWVYHRTHKPLPMSRVASNS